MTTTPLVDIAIVTYNHEKYIAQAIESVLEQQTDFKFRLIIGDDCSEDNTQSIIRTFAERYPDQILTILYSQHLGIYNKDRVGIKVLNNCTAKYIALLEGDDYWTSRHKLQKQIDFLENHPDCAICFHQVKAFNEINNESQVLPLNFKRYSTIEDIILLNYIPTCSVVFRNRCLDEYFMQTGSLTTCDWQLHVFNAQFGKIGYLDDIMATYRIHSGGSWSGLSETEKCECMVAAYEWINTYLKFKYAKILRPILNDYYFRLAGIYNQAGDIRLAKSYITKCLVTQMLNLKKPTLNHFKLFAKLLFPSVYSIAKNMKRNLIVRS